MKKFSLVILSLGLCLGLAACNKEGDQGPAPANKPPLNEEVKKADTGDLEKVEEETKKEDALNSGSEKERLNALLEESDYISLVELSSTADNQMELRILTNFKGNLSNIEFDEPKNLSPNKQYLIFYHDSEDGSIIPTNGDASMIEVENSDDPVLTKVQARYATNEGDPAEDKTKEKKTTEKKSTEEKKTSDSKKTEEDKKN